MWVKDAVGAKKESNEATSTKKQNPDLLRR